MKIDIDRLTEAALIELNHRVVERLRFLEQMRAHGTMLEFSIGDPCTSGWVRTRLHNRSVLAEGAILQVYGSVAGRPYEYHVPKQG